MPQSADDAALAALHQQFTAEYRPETPHERCLVDEAVRCEFMLRMLFAAERKLMSRPFEEIFADGGQILARLERRINLARKSYNAAIAELRELLELRRSAARPAPPKQTAASKPASPVFVPAPERPKTQPPVNFTMKNPLPPVPAERALASIPYRR